MPSLGPLDDRPPDSAGLPTTVVARTQHLSMAQRWALLSLTCLATVYLGWHFLVDDVAGLVLGWAAVRLGLLTSRSRS